MQQKIHKQTKDHLDSLIWIQSFGIKWIFVCSKSFLVLIIMLILSTGCQFVQFAEWDKPIKCWKRPKIDVNHRVTNARIEEIDIYSQENRFLCIKSACDLIVTSERWWKRERDRQKVRERGEKNEVEIKVWFAIDIALSKCIDAFPLWGTVCDFCIDKLCICRLTAKIMD